LCFDTKREAKAWVAKHDGINAAGSAEMTLLELAEKHSAWFADLVATGLRDPVTADGYDIHRNKYLAADPIAKVKLALLDTPTCQGFVDRVLSRKSHAMARAVRRSFSAWCAHGVRKGWLKTNPVRETELVKKTANTVEDHVEIPPKTVLASLIAAAATGPDPMRDTAIISLLMHSGLRISEMLALSDTAVSVRPQRGAQKAGGMVSVEEALCGQYHTLGPVKSAAAIRKIPIAAGAMGAVQAWRAARGPSMVTVIDGKRTMGRLFPGNGKAFWHYSEFRSQCWVPLMERAGLSITSRPGARYKTGTAKGCLRVYRIPDFGPHTLRHAYASVQIANGVTIKRLQRLLGHAKAEMTLDTYGHLWEDLDNDAALADAAERAISAFSETVAEIAANDGSAV
jgi:integrase